VHIVSSLDREQSRITATVKPPMFLQFSCSTKCTKATSELSFHACHAANHNFGGRNFLRKGIFFGEGWVASAYITLLCKNTVLTTLPVSDDNIRQDSHIDYIAIQPELLRTLVSILVCLTSPVSFSYLSFHLLIFSSHSPVFILAGPTVSQFTNHLLCFSFSPSFL